MTEIVRCIDVEKRYQRGRQVVEVLNGINLAIEEGDFLALMGPSGSGKTTLLNLIGGLDTPSAGTVEVAGVALQTLSGRELARWRSHNVGFIFQFYNLLPVLSAQLGVELPLLRPISRVSSASAMPPPHWRSSALATGAGTSPASCRAGSSSASPSRARWSPTRACSCAMSPREISTVGRPDEILDLLGVLNRDHGKTIIMVTHDPKAADHARHTLHMDKGTLVTEADTGAGGQQVPS
ncbi:MAG: ATP-binding cassette domain-containing protein [Pseudomonadales bacterium]